MTDRSGFFIFSFLIIALSSCATGNEEPILTQYELSIFPRLDVDNNGYYRLKLNESKFQTVHRISGQLLKNGEEPNPAEKVSWESSHYWVLGDTAGFVIRRILTPDGNWVNVDTSYVTGFEGYEIPTINPVSYSGNNGEINTVIGPAKTMLGDTMTVKCAFQELSEVVYIILDS